MNFKKTGFTLAGMGLVATAVIGLASCGSSTVRTPDFSKITVDSSTSCTVTFWHTMGQASQTLLDTMIEKFNESYPNITITHAAQGGYSDILSKISKAIPAKTTPTMAYCYPDHVATYGEGTNVLKLNGYDGSLMSTEAEGYTDTFVDAFYQEGAHYDNDGTVYSMPFSKSTEALFYNATVFTAKGWEAPLYWENPNEENDIKSVIGLCKAIKADTTLTGVTAPLGYDSDDNMFITLAHQYGVPYTSIDENGVGQFDFNCDAAKALVTKIKGWYDAGYFVTKGTLPNNTYTSTKFINAEILMSIGSTGGTSYNSSKTFTTDVAAIPQQANLEGSTAVKGQILQGPSICFMATSNVTDIQLKAAWVFYNFITNTENSAAFSNSTGYEPVRKASYTCESYDSDALGAIYGKVAAVTSTEAVQSAYFTSPVFVGSATAREEVGGLMVNVLGGSLTVDAAFTKAYNNCLFAQL